MSRRALSSFCGNPQFARLWLKATLAGEVGNLHFNKRSEDYYRLRGNKTLFQKPRAPSLILARLYFEDGSTLRLKSVLLQWLGCRTPFHRDTRPSIRLRSRPDVFSWFPAGSGRGSHLPRDIPSTDPRTASAPLHFRPGSLNPPSPGASNLSTPTSGTGISLSSRLTQKRSMLTVLATCALSLSPYFPRKPARSGLSLPGRAAVPGRVTKKG